MHHYPQSLPPSSNLWKDLGVTVVKWLDSSFLYGVGGLSKEVTAIVLRAIHRSQSPLNWTYPWTKLYRNQDSLLWVVDQDGGRLYLPQVVVIGSVEAANEAAIRIELSADKNFQAPLPVEEGWEFYRRSSTGRVQKIFFNDENARLVKWEAVTRTLTFQGCYYFDYLKTNLALDAPLPVFRSLREYITTTGRIEDLASSKLANSTGINGLIFSNDGYLIFQMRQPDVLVRPNELCSGFSGTIDKIDITNAFRTGGTLDQLDVPREMVEELGIHRHEIAARRFLGLTRELIRGGAPEMFYALQIDQPAEVILQRIPRDHEGLIRKIFFGPFASIFLASPEDRMLPIYFWSLIRQAQSTGNGPISVPFLTNMVLWYHSLCPHQVGTDILPRE